MTQQKNKTKNNLGACDWSFKGSPDEAMMESAMPRYIKEDQDLSVLGIRGLWKIGNGPSSFSLYECGEK